MFRFAKNGRTRDAGLGPYPEVSLADARMRAFEWRKLLVAGFHPLDQRNAARASDLVAASKSIKFDDVLPATLPRMSSVGEALNTPSNGAHH